MFRAPTPYIQVSNPLSLSLTTLVYRIFILCHLETFAYTAGWLTAASKICMSHLSFSGPSWRVTTSVNNFTPTVEP